MQQPWALQRGVANTQAIERRDHLVRMALLRLAFVRLESLRTARSIRTSDRSAFCAATTQLSLIDAAVSSHCKRACIHPGSSCQRKGSTLAISTSKFARATTVLMKYVPCSFEFLKLQSRQSAAVKFDRLKSCTSRKYHQSCW